MFGNGSQNLASPLLAREEHSPLAAAHDLEDDFPGNKADGNLRQLMGRDCKLPLGAAACAATGCGMLLQLPLPSY